MVQAYVRKCGKEVGLVVWSDSLLGKEVVLLVWSDSLLGKEVMLLVWSDSLLGREMVLVVWSDCPCPTETINRPRHGWTISDCALCKYEHACRAFISGRTALCYAYIRV
jgi:hypothetical protein